MLASIHAPNLTHFAVPQMSDRARVFGVMDDVFWDCSVDAFIEWPSAATLGSSEMDYAIHSPVDVQVLPCVYSTTLPCVHAKFWTKFRIGCLNTKFWLV